MNRFEFGATVLVSGHRGDRVHGDENTMAAMRRAVDAGVDMIETDIRMTKDGALILMHDADVARTTDGSGLVRDHTLAEIRTLNAAKAAGDGRFEPPATLAELITFAQAHPALLLNIELKDYPEDGETIAYACAEKTAQMLLDAGLAERTWINSFSGKLLEFVYRCFGEQFHYHGFYPWFILGQMEIEPERFIDVACMQHRVQLADGTVQKCEEPMCPKEWFDYLLERGIMPLMAPSLRDYEKYDTAFSWGSRAVNPDDPYAMLLHLRQKGLHK